LGESRGTEKNKHSREASRPHTTPLLDGRRSARGAGAPGAAAPVDVRHSLARCQCCSRASWGSRPCVGVRETGKGVGMAAGLVCERCRWDM